MRRTKREEARHGPLREYVRPVLTATVSVIRDGWKQRHKDALGAWEQGDVERLCELCNREIRTAVRKAFDNNPQLKNVTGIEVELRAFARKGVEKAYGRYEPSKGSFQAYAWQDIYWETRRGAKALREEAFREEALREEALQDADSSEEERPDQALQYAFESHSLDEWRDIIKRLDKELLSTWRSFLDTRKAELTRGDRKRERKYEAILANVIERGIVLKLYDAKDGEFIKISGPLEVGTLRERQKALRRPAEDVSYSKLAKSQGVSDKTIKRWDERAAEDPEYEDHELLDRLFSIVAPVAWRREQRRREAE